MRGHDIICIAPNPWDDMWRRRHHLMTRLAKENRVLWIEPPHRFPRPWPEAARNPAGEQIPLQVRKKLFLCRLWKPLPLAETALRKSIRIVGQLNEWCCTIQVRRLSRTLRFTEPILWLYYTDVSQHLLGQCGERIAVCDVFDRYSAYSHLDAWGRERVEQQERELLARVDLVFAASEQLRRYCREFNDNVFLVPNGVDMSPYEAAGPAPNDIVRIPHPIVGFAGKISSNKIDLALIRYVVECRPRWSVVLVGPVLPDLQRIISTWPTSANLHVLGQKQEQDLPAYIAAFDVCIVPYLDNEERRHSDPLKVYEYLAAGKPIVATGFPQNHPLAGLVSLAGSPQEFLNLLEQCLTHEDHGLASRHIEAARANSWEVRVQEMGRIIEQHAAKGHGLA